MIKVYVPRQRTREILRTVSSSLEGTSIPKYQDIDEELYVAYCVVDEFSEMAVVASEEAEEWLERAVVETSKRKTLIKHGRRNSCNFNPSIQNVWD